MVANPESARKTIADELSAYLKRTHVRKVHFAQATVAPPVLAYVTNFPRLSVPLSGRQYMEMALDERTIRTAVGRGEALFAGRNCWNRPEWSTPVKMLTVLFGKSHVGVSLVLHDGRSDEPPPALKTSLGLHEGLTQHLLAALMAIALQPRSELMDCMVTESLLRACLQNLTTRATSHARKAARSYEALCLYVQENYQNQITRESVARNFGLTPNHVSRLFRREGNMQFRDYLTLVRVDRAKFMLKTYKSPLKEIALNCGYQDLAYFCRVFKAMTDVTPTDYRLAGK